MQQAARIPRGRLKGMAERVPEIEKRAVALLSLISHHNLGFHLNRPPHRFETRSLIASGQLGPMLFEPLKECRIAQQAVLNNFAVTRKKITFFQSREHIDIGQNQARLVERADQVLAMRGVDARLAPDRAVNLRQQRCRHLHEPDPTAQNGRGKSHQIADHTSAKRNHHIIALNLLREQPLHGLLEVRPGFRGLSGRQAHMVGCDPCRCKARDQRIEMQAPDALIRYNGHPGAL